MGRGRGKQLERLLCSVIPLSISKAPRLFDQIVAVVTHLDSEVDDVLQRFKVKVSRCPEWPWKADFSNVDFAAARNASLDMLTTDWWVWLDSDDVLTHEQYVRFLKLKEDLHQHEADGFNVLRCVYNYGHLADGSPTSEHHRERMMKRVPEYRWKYPIHEVVAGAQTRFRLFENVAVDHYRDGEADVERNVTILRRAVAETGDIHMRYCLAKDLCEAKQWAEGIPTAEALLDGGFPFPDGAAVLCRVIAYFYREAGNTENEVKWARRGIKNNPKFAEFWTSLADAAMKAKNADEGRLFYQMALGCRTADIPAASFASHYLSIPSRNLYLDECARGRFVSALGYNKLLLDSKDVDAHQKADQDRDTIWRALRPLIDAAVAGEACPPRQPVLAWLMPSMDMANPSTRLRRFRVYEELERQGQDTFIVTDYWTQTVAKTMEGFRNATAVVFTIYGEYELQLMRRLKERGVRILFDHCEELFGFPFEDECMHEADFIVCCSTELMRKTEARGYAGKCVVVKDPYEVGGWPSPGGVRPFLSDKEAGDRTGKPKAVYMGMGGNSFLAHDVLRPAVEAAGFELVVISEWENATIKWGADTWLRDFMSCDVALCPQRDGIQDAKSNNKITTAMALGVPVIASPMPAYREIIEHGVNGYLCPIADSQAWTAALVELLDPEKRKAIAVAGLESIKDEYSVKKIAADWFRAMTGPKPQVVGGAAIQSGRKEPVDLIITVYNNVEYVKLTVATLQMATDYPYRLIISDAGSDEETWAYIRTLKGVLIIGRPGLRKTYSQASNDGIMAGTSRYVAILNSDLIFSKGWLSAIVEKMDQVDRLAACGVMSNCDADWLWKGIDFSIPVGAADRLKLYSGMKMEQITPHMTSLGEFMGASNEARAHEFVRREWIAGYCYVFARVALQEVGLFDELFKNGCEDLDLCRRLRLAGYDIGQAADAFVFHFGGISRGAYELEASMQRTAEGGLTAYQAEDRYNHIVYRAKWEKKKIGIYTGPGWEKWDEKTVERGMGGSETWASELAGEFAARGYLVQVFGDPEAEHVDARGVVWRHHSNMGEALKYDYLDAFISSRTCEPLRGNLHSLQNFVMVHDVFLSAKRDYNLEDWKVKKYAYLSEWHGQFLREWHAGMKREKMFLTHNGVREQLYAQQPNVVKRNMTVWSSSPDRGLRELLQMLPEIRKAVPDFEVVVAYGFENWDKAATKRNDPEELAHLADVKLLISITDGCRYVGRISKVELARLQVEANVWLYPTWFSETFCITAVENGLAKNAIITSPIAGLTSTLAPGSALFIHGDSKSKAYRDEFLEKAIYTLTDPDALNFREAMAEKAYRNALPYTWANAADAWLEEFGWK